MQMPKTKQEKLEKAKQLMDKLLNVFEEYALFNIDIDEFKEQLKQFVEKNCKL